MVFSHIEFSVEDGGIGFVTVNRPQKRNALNAAVMGDLARVFERAAADPAIRGLVLTGAGDKAFIAGADIQEIAGTNPAEAERLSRYGQNIFRALETMRKPSVAAINGFAFGGGLELAMACTARIASATAKLGQPEVKLGIVPGYGATQRLPRLVGRGAALEILLTGETIDAAEAYRIGLVNRVVDPAELMRASVAWLSKVLANGPLAVALTLEAVDAGYDAGFDAGQRFESLAFGLSAATGDRHEGTSAFLEKRAPQFTGK